jgi:hypothetical protein
MRVYAAPGYGLGAPETENFRRLSPRSRALVADELQHPDSHKAVHWILSQRDPEAALADALRENVHQASRDAASGSGLGDGLGRSFFKKLMRFHSRIFKTFKKIDPGLHALTAKKKHHGGPPVSAATAAAAAAPPAPAPAQADPSASTPVPVAQPAPMPYPAQSVDPSTYTPPVPVNYVQQPPPTDPNAAAPADPNAAAASAAADAASPASAPAPTGPYTTGTDETAGLPTATGYTLTVEGQTITNYPVDITQVSSLVASGTQPGDRFEISADGVGTGLRVRTTTGFISIPDSMRAQVMAMPRGQVLALLTQAAATVAAAGVPTPAAVPTTTPATSAAPDNSGLFWLLGAGGVAAAAMSMGGKRR